MEFNFWRHHAHSSESRGKIPNVSLRSQQKQRQSIAPPRSASGPRKLTHKPFNVLLPLFPRVVFVDWNGVLSRDVFWGSIATNPNHPFHRQMTESRRRLFAEQRKLVDAWQRGEVDSNVIIKSLDLPLDRRFKNDFLLRRLERDCREMRVDNLLLQGLAEACHDSYIVLATDNIDPFFMQLDAKPELRNILDAVLCSSELGVLKSENIVSFFEPWLKQHHLTFSQAILIDDSITICSRFENAGGSAIIYDSVENALHQLRSWKYRFGMSSAS